MKKTNIILPRFDLDQRMLHIIMQHTSSLGDIGLLSGKMGIIIFFSHHHRYAQNDVYDDVADKLMDEVLSKIHKKLSINFDSGLSGIGWAIEYLIQNGFMEGDSLEVCNEIDKMIMQTDPRRLNDLTLETGMEGLLHYILAHIKGGSQKGGLPFDDTYLKDVYNAALILDKEKISKSLRVLINKYIKFYRGRELDYHMDIKLFLRKRKVIEKELLNTPLGIKEGLAGVLLRKTLC